MLPVVISLLEESSLDGSFLARQPERKDLAVLVPRKGFVRDEGHFPFFLDCVRAAVPKLGLPRCSWTAVPRSLHPLSCWPGFLGVAVQEPLCDPSLRTTGPDDHHS